MFNLVETATGILIANSEDPILDPATGRHVVETTNRTGVWNTSTEEYDPYPAVRIIPVSTFMKRFTPTEIDSLVEAAKTSKRANAFITILPMLGSADLDSNFITGAVTKMVQGNVLVNAARAAEILA